MKFGICHFAYLAKYAIWHQKRVKTRIFITLHLAPYSFTAFSSGKACDQKL